MSIESFVAFMMRERHATSYDDNELAAIITHLDAWIAKGRPRRIVNPTTRPARVYATFDKPAMMALRRNAAEVFEMRQ